MSQIDILTVVTLRVTMTCLIEMHQERLEMARQPFNAVSINLVILCLLLHKIKADALLIACLHSLNLILLELDT